MAGTTVHTNRRSFGAITVEEAEPVRLRPRAAATALTARRFRYTWRPPGALREQLPPGFALSLQCVVGADGVRRFYPWTGYEAFLAQASAGGLAVLCQRQKLSAQQRHSYRAMRLVFLLARRMAEFFGHRFDHGRDLSVVPSGRTDPTERDILPDDLGQDAHGAGERWGVEDLIRRGAEAARSAGYVRPTTAHCIHYGLVEAARLNPLPVAEERVPSLVRSALFNIDPVEELDRDLLDVVTERVLVALDRHLGDETEPFNKWFLGPHSSLVQQIAKQERSRGGRLGQGEVRKALLHVGWQAYDFASNAIHAQMRTFQNALPERLTGRERLLFEHMHLRQPYLGNLPLALLAERFGILKGVLWELWEGLPGLGLVPVLHRLLDYYGTMAARRREVDRLIKSGRPLPFDDGAYEPQDQGNLFQEIAAEVREIRGIDCGCPRREWWAELKGEPGATIRIVHRCIACDVAVESILTREEFTELGRPIG
jgi:hypothetical protein